MWYRLSPGWCYTFFYATDIKGPFRKHYCVGGLFDFHQWHLGVPRGLVKSGHPWIFANYVYPLHNFVCVIWTYLIYFSFWMISIFPKSRFPLWKIDKICVPPSMKDTFVCFLSNPPPPVMFSYQYLLLLWNFKITAVKDSNQVIWDVVWVRCC